MSAWDGFIGSVIAGLISSAATIGVALFIYRKQTGEAQKKQASERKEALRKSIEPLYQDLGTLIHHAEQADFDAAMAHIKIMAERKSRGEYDIPNASVTIQNECVNLLNLFSAMRSSLLQQPDLAKESIRRWALQTVIRPFAFVAKQNLDVERQQ